MITLNYSPEGYTGAHVEMRIPDGSLTVDEVLDYFQRFLTAAGYMFDDGERVKAIKTGYSGCSGDILTFSDDGTPYVYDFGGVAIGTSISGSSYLDDSISLD